MSFYSPLRYPGGKGKVADYFKQIFKENQLYDGIYIEPYAGGSSIALSLLFNQYASQIIINDIDQSIYAFWHSVLNDTENLCRLIRDTPLTLDNWQQQREVQKEKDSQNLLALGFSTFFLNRTNRSGILNAGLIGGLGQTGKWKMDARFEKKELIFRIERIAEYADSITISNLDAVELVMSLRSSLPAKSIFYFDPPYYIKGKDLYLNYYCPEDHQKIADEVSKIVSQKWIVTYDNVEPICKLYSGFRSKSFELSYSAGALNRVGKEVMFFSNNTNIPERPV